MNRLCILFLLFCLVTGSQTVAFADGTADDGGTGRKNPEQQDLAAEVSVKDTISRQERLVTRVRSGRVREEPSFDAAVEYGLEQGDVVSLLKKKGEWNYVERDDGKKGWGHDILFFAPPALEKPEGYSGDGETLSGGPLPEERNRGGKTALEGPSDRGEEPVYTAGGEEVPEEEIMDETPEEAEVQEPVEENEAAEDSAPADTLSSRSNVSVHWMDEERLSLNFLDVDIREALSALALEREINIVTSRDVAGNITVHLYNSSLDNALEAITLAGGFTYIKRGDLYYVFKPKEARDPQAENLQMRIFKLKYAGVDKVQEILSALPDTRPVRIHDSTKTIIAEDTPENLRKIENIINQWDRMPRQVMIEAKILEITLTDDMSFGVNWADILGDGMIGTGGFSTAVMPTTTAVSPVPGGGEGVFFNLITAAGTDKKFTAALDALQKKTRINTLSTPKILAIHGKSAKVQVGGQQGYTVTTTNEGVSTETIEFIDTGTILQITPFIDEEDNVLLDVRPSIRSARIEEGIPVVNSTEVSTWLTAKNGETVFIGGLIQDTKTKSREMVPCLGGAPGIGSLFGRTTQGIGKSELVVLITPTILPPGTRVAGKEYIERTRGEEERLKKEPLPAGEQFLDFLSPVK